MPRLYKYDFGTKYSPDFENIFQIINGESSFIINNNGIDLDNIDNVFRMAYHMGIGPNDKSIPVNLVKNLKTRKDKDNFIIKKEYLDLIHIWYDLRSEVYRRFIYLKEYLSFEFLVFQLIAEYSKHFETEGIINLFHLTDEALLWNLLDKNKYPESVSNIARRLLLHELPESYSIIRSESFDKKEFLLKEGILKSISEEVTQYLCEKKGLTLPFEICYHVTTDHRKTCRKIETYVENDGKLTKETIAEDNSFIVIGIIGRSPLSDELISIITRRTIEILSRENLGSFEYLQFSDRETMSSELLF